jgi:formylglycine-generating enzyme required for sulfatase activity
MGAIATHGYARRRAVVRVICVRLIRHVLVWGCGLLALVVAALGARSFWRCDEAAYCTYETAPAPSQGIDRRQLVGSYPGGIFWLALYADITVHEPVDWYGGPPTELIPDSAPTARLVPKRVPAGWGPRWRWGGFNLWAQSNASPRGRCESVVVPHWALFLMLGWPAYRLLRRRWIARRWRKNGKCVRCGYDLRASGDVCPECGHGVREPTVISGHGRRGRRWPIPAAGALALGLVVLWLGMGRGRGQEPRAVRWEPGTALPDHPLPQRVELEAAPGVWMRFALIPSGRFVMGSPSDEVQRTGNEDQHEVIISKPFYMGQTCVTQEQYEAVMGSNPSASYNNGAKNPVDKVNWKDAMEFCRSLSKRSGQSVHLPTEAQWEYACRAGTSTPFNTGRTLQRKPAYHQGYTYPNNRADIPADGSVAVGTFAPNSWGLYDMHGTMWQWCSDWSGDYPADEVTDPTGPKDGALRVLRGGSRADAPRQCRSAFRLLDDPVYQFDIFSFRVAMSAGVD